MPFTNSKQAPREKSKYLSVVSATATMSTVKSVNGTKDTQSHKLFSTGSSLPARPSPFYDLLATLTNKVVKRKCLS